MLSVNNVVKKEIEDLPMNNLVPVTLLIPRDALDVLAFRYYAMNIAENDQALAEAAVREVVTGHLSVEYSNWQTRKMGDRAPKNR